MAGKPVKGASLAHNPVFSTMHGKGRPSSAFSHFPPLGGEAPQSGKMTGWMATPSVGPLSGTLDEGVVQDGKPANFSVGTVGTSRGVTHDPPL